MFILVYILRFSFASVDEILPCWSVRMKATGQYFLVVLFTMLYMAVLTFESVNEILKYQTMQMKVTEQYLSVEVPTQ